MRRRRRQGNEHLTPPDDLPSLLPDDDVVLVEADGDGTFLVFGSGPLHGLDLLPTAMFSVTDSATLGEAIAQSIGGLNAAAQMAETVGEARGLVRLAPETLKALREGAQPLMKDGWNLGTLTQEGSITSQVRWLPADSAGATRLLAALGPVATLVAIQWQLTQISRLVEKNIALTNDVLEQVRSPRWATVRAHHDAILTELQHAIAIGAVTDAIWNQAQAQASETTLRASRDDYLRQVQLHASKLESLTGAQARRDWIAQNAEAVLQDVDCLLTAERAWFAYQALRIGHLRTTAAVNAADARLQQRLVDQVGVARQRTLATSRPLVEGIHRHFRLMAECPGGMGLTVKGRRRTPSEVAAAAAALADSLQSIANDGVLRIAEAEPESGWFGVPTRRSDIVHRLRWLLAPDERVVAIAGKSADFWWVKEGYTVFTDTRILFLHDDSFLKHGRVDREYTWAQVRDISRSKEPGSCGGYNLVIETTMGTVSLETPREVASSDVDHLTSLLLPRVAPATPALEPEARQALSSD